MINDLAAREQRYRYILEVLLDTKQVKEFLSGAAPEELKKIAANLKKSFKESGVAIDETAVKAKRTVGVALEAMKSWAIAGTVIYGTIRAIRQYIQLVEEANKAQTRMAITLGRERGAEMYGEAIRLAKEYGVAVSVVADALSEYSREFDDNAKAMQGAQTAIKLAIVTFEDAGTIARSLISLQKQFGATIEETERWAVALFNVRQHVANVDISQLVTDLNKSASLAKNLGLSFGQMASFAAIAQRADPQFGFFSLSTFLTKIVQNFSAVSGFLHEAGIELQGNSEWLTQLLEKFSTLPQAQQLRFQGMFGQFGIGAISFFLQHGEEVVKLTQDQTSAEQEYFEAVRAYAGSVQAAVHSLDAAKLQLAANTQQVVVPALTSLFGVFSDILSVLSRLHPAISGLIAVGGITGIIGLGGMWAFRGLWKEIAGTAMGGKLTGMLGAMGGLKGLGLSLGIPIALQYFLRVTGLSTDPATRDAAGIAGQLAVVTSITNMVLRAIAGYTGGEPFGAQFAQGLMLRRMRHMPASTPGQFAQMYKGAGALGTLGVAVAVGLLYTVVPQIATAVGGTAGQVIGGLANFGINFMWIRMAISALAKVLGGTVVGTALGGPLGMAISIAVPIIIELGANLKSLGFRQIEDMPLAELKELPSLSLAMQLTQDRIRQLEEAEKQLASSGGTLADMNAELVLSFDTLASKVSILKQIFEALPATLENTADKLSKLGFYKEVFFEKLIEQSKQMGRTIPQEAEQYLRSLMGFSLTGWGPQGYGYGPGENAGQRIAEIAKRKYAGYAYDQGGIVCNTFVANIYEEAGLPRYGEAGAYAAYEQLKSYQVTQPQPGDLAFWQRTLPGGGIGGHMGIVVDASGRIIQMGTAGVQTVAPEQIPNFLGYYRPPELQELPAQKSFFEWYMGLTEGEKDLKSAIDNILQLDAAEEQARQEMLNMQLATADFTKMQESLNLALSLSGEKLSQLDTQYKSYDLGLGTIVDRTSLLLQKKEELAHQSIILRGLLAAEADKQIYYQSLLSDGIFDSVEDQTEYTQAVNESILAQEKYKTQLAEIAQQIKELGAEVMRVNLETLSTRISDLSRRLTLGGLQKNILVSGGIFTTADALTFARDQLKNLLSIVDAQKTYIAGLRLLSSIDPSFQKDLNKMLEDYLETLAKVAATEKEIRDIRKNQFPLYLPPYGLGDEVAWSALYQRSRGMEAMAGAMGHAPEFGKAEAAISSLGDSLKRYVVTPFDDIPNILQKIISLSQDWSDTLDESLRKLGEFPSTAFAPILNAVNDYYVAFNKMITEPLSPVYWSPLWGPPALETRLDLAHEEAQKRIQAITWGPTNVGIFEEAQRRGITTEQISGYQNWLYGLALQLQAGLISEETLEQLSLPLERIKEINTEIAMAMTASPETAAIQALPQGIAGALEPVLKNLPPPIVNVTVEVDYASKAKVKTETLRPSDWASAGVRPPLDRR